MLLKLFLICKCWNSESSSKVVCFHEIYCTIACEAFCLDSRVDCNVGSENAESSLHLEQYSASLSIYLGLFKALKKKKQQKTKTNKHTNKQKNPQPSRAVIGV